MLGGWGVGRGGGRMHEMYDITSESTHYSSHNIFSLLFFKFDFNFH